MRINKYIALCGVASRRKAEELILAGRVTVNDEVMTELSYKVDEENDIVKVDDKLIKEENKLVYILLNKPEGYITTVKDQFDRPSVLDLVSDIKERVYPIGRLDYETSGLLLLTNDGDLTYKLTHPKHEVDKMCNAINHPVLRLRRSAMGKIKIGDCEIGKYRYLTEDEIKYLKNL